MTTMPLPGSSQFGHRAGRFLVKAVTVVALLFIAISIFRLLLPPSFQRFSPAYLTGTPIKEYCGNRYKDQADLRVYQNRIMTAAEACAKVDNESEWNWLSIPIEAREYVHRFVGKEEFLTCFERRAPAADEFKRGEHLDTPYSKLVWCWNVEWAAKSEKWLATMSKESTALPGRPPIPMYMPMPPIRFR